MKFLKLSLILLLISGNVQAAAPTRAYTYVANNTIDPLQNNANENALYSYLQVGVDTYASGSITGAAISGSASIPYGSLSLSGSIVNADISASAAIVASKLDLTSPGSIGTTTPGLGKFTNFTVTGSVFLFGSTNQGDILYDNGSSLTRLTPGTNGQVLKTGGSSANPSWTTLVTGYDYGTSASAFSTITTGLKTAYGNISVANKGTTALSNLPFTSSTSYKCTCNQVAGTLANMNGPCAISYSSGSAATIQNAADTTFTMSWMCIGS